MKKFKKAESVNIDKIDKVISSTPQENKNFISKSLEIAHQINLHLEEENLNQKDLARILEKSEAEISKWLCGTHNFTIRTIVNIETAIGKEIVVTPCKIKENHLKYLSEVYRASSNKKIKIGERPNQKSTFDLVNDRQTKAAEAA